MSTFGLDIGSTSIKAVQLEGSGDRFSLLAAGITASPQPGISSDNAKDLAAVAQSIKKLITDTKITTKEVNLSIPESQVFTRLIHLPPLTDQEVSSAISWQAEPYIPIPIDQASLDYQVISRREAQGTDPGGVDVLLVATPKGVVAKYLKLCDMVGLTPLNMESELLALTRSLTPAKETVLLADLGATSTDLAVVRDRVLLVTRSVNTAGGVLTRAVSAGLSVTAERAEEYKKSYGLHPEALEGKVKTVLEPVFKLVIDEMKKIMQYYKADISRQDQVSSVILSGGTSGMNEITSFLAQGLGVEVVIGDPFSSIARDERTAKLLTAWSPLYGIAVGLAENM